MVFFPCTKFGDFFTKFSEENPYSTKAGPFAKLNAQVAKLNEDKAVFHEGRPFVDYVFLFFSPFGGLNVGTRPWRLGFNLEDLGVEGV